MRSRWEARVVVERTMIPFVGMMLPAGGHAVIPPKQSHAPASRAAIDAAATAATHATRSLTARQYAAAGPASYIGVGFGSQAMNWRKVTKRTSGLEAA